MKIVHSEEHMPKTQPQTAKPRSYQTWLDNDTHTAWEELRGLLGCRSKSEVLQRILPPARDRALRERAAELAQQEAPHS